MLYLIELTREARDIVDYLIGCDRAVRRQYIPGAPYMLVWLPNKDCFPYIRCMGGMYMVPVTGNVLSY